MRNMYSSTVGRGLSGLYETRLTDNVYVNGMDTIIMTHTLIRKCLNYLP